MKNDYTYGEWLWQWYRLYKKDYISEDWQKQYERAFILHVPEELFNKRLIDLTALDVDLSLYAMGRTRTAKFLYSLYCASLKKAYVLGMIHNDLGSQITNVRYSSRKSKSLSNSEIKIFLSAVKDYDVYYFYKFLLLTGCRRSEALSLRKEDVDFEKGLIHIRGTKTYNADRYLPLTAPLVELLKECPLSKNVYFPFSKDYVTKFFKKHCPNHKLHDLRHTFATYCAIAGVHPSVTQSLLGHATPEFTLKVYTHVESKLYSADVEKVQKKIPVDKPE